MASQESPAQWWVKQMIEEADGDRVKELSDKILDSCCHEEKYSRSEAYVALSKVFAIMLLDAGRSGRQPKYIKSAACEMVACWLDAVDKHVRSKQH